MFKIFVFAAFVVALIPYSNSEAGSISPCQAQCVGQFMEHAQCALYPGVLNFCTKFSDATIGNVSKRALRCFQNLGANNDALLVCMAGGMSSSSGCSDYERDKSEIASLAAKCETGNNDKTPALDETSNATAPKNTVTEKLNVVTTETIPPSKKPLVINEKTLNGYNFRLIETDENSETCAYAATKEEHHLLSGSSNLIHIQLPCSVGLEKLEPKKLTVIIGGEWQAGSPFLVQHVTQGQTIWDRP